LQELTRTFSFVLVGELDARFEELEIRNGGEGSWTPVLVAIRANIYTFIRW